MRLLKILSVFSLILFSKNADAQDLLQYVPILISNSETKIINGQKANKIIVDYFNPEFAKLNVEFLKYSSKKKIVEIYNIENKNFQPLINIDGRVTKENYFGLFRYFDIIPLNENEFTTKPTSGSRPSHTEIIKKIKILQQNKQYLILQINFTDIYDLENNVVLILQDFDNNE